MIDIKSIFDYLLNQYCICSDIKNYGKLPYTLIYYNYYDNSLKEKFTIVSQPIEKKDYLFNPNIKLKLNLKVNEKFNYIINDENSIYQVYLEFLDIKHFIFIYQFNNYQQCIIPTSNPIKFIKNVNKYFAEYLQSLICLWELKDENNNIN